MKDIDPFIKSACFAAVTLAACIVSIIYVIGLNQKRFIEAGYSEQPDPRSSHGTLWVKK